MSPPFPSLSFIVMPLPLILARDPAFGEFVRKAITIAGLMAASAYLLAISLVIWSFFAKGAGARRVIAVLSFVILIPALLIFVTLAICSMSNYSAESDFTLFGVLAFFGIPALLSLTALRQVAKKSRTSAEA